MGTNQLGDNIKASLDSLSEADKNNRTKVMQAMGNPIEDWVDDRGMTEIDNSKNLALDTVEIPKFIGSAYTNVLSDPCDLTTGNWTKTNGATAEATEYTINGHKLTKLGSTTGTADPIIYQNASLPDTTTRKSLHVILRNENVSDNITQIFIKQNGASSDVKAYIDVIWDSLTVNLNTGFKVNYKWLDNSTIEIWSITNVGESGHTSWQFRIDPQSTANSDQFIYATECQLVDSSEVMYPFVEGTHTKDTIDKDFAMPAQFTFDMIVEPKFLYDTGIDHRFFDFMNDASHIFQIYYDHTGNQIRTGWVDGGTYRILTTSQFDDGTSYTNLNQRLRIIGSMNLSSGGQNDSRFIVIPLESGSISEDASWNGTSDIKSSTFVTLSLGYNKYSGADQANSDFEYLRIYDGLLVGNISSNEDAEKLIEQMALLYEVTQNERMNTRHIDSTVSTGLALQRLINDVRTGVGIQNKAIKARHLNSETWHEVGASGEPSFENGWVNYSSSYNTAAFYKDVEGFVHLKGLVKNGTVNTTIFTLPTGYRPGRQWLMITETNSNTDCRLDVKTNGNIGTQGGSSAWVSLDGIIFYAGY